MATLQQVQNFLRQKRASGRLSPSEISEAYRGYFGAESDASIARAAQDLSAQRAATAERQADERLAQQNRIILMQEEEAKAAEKAKELQGLAQSMKIAVPSLFDTDKEGSGRWGGAQGTTQKAISATTDDAAIGTQEAVQDLSTPSLTQEAPTVTPQQEGMFGGQTFGEALSEDLKDITGIGGDKTSQNLLNYGKSYVLSGGNYAGIVSGIGVKLVSKFIQRNVQLIKGLLNWGEEETGTVVDEDLGTGETPDTGLSFESIYDTGDGGFDPYGSGSASDIDTAAGGYGATGGDMESGSGDYGTGDMDGGSMWA